MAKLALLVCLLAGAGALRIGSQTPLGITVDTLHNLESKYGGFVSGVAATTGRTHMGGDRFDPKRNAYGGVYAEKLNWLLERVPSPNVLEVGILAGSGIATWATVMPTSRIYGFDLDPSNTQKREDAMEKVGFNPASVTLAKFDQMKEDKALVQEILAGDTLSFVMDDGCHTPRCALNTWRSVSPFLSGTFVYIIEDTAADKSTQEAIQQDMPGAKLEVFSTSENAGLVVVSREEKEPLPIRHMRFYTPAAAKQQEDDAKLRAQQHEELEAHKEKKKAEQK